MLEFLKEKTDEKAETFALYDGGEVVARAIISGTSLEKVEYKDIESNKKYGDFLLRSTAFVMKNRGRDLTVKFTDDRLTVLGFNVTENGEMKADGWKLNLDKCGGCNL